VVEQQEKHMFIRKVPCSFLMEGLCLFAEAWFGIVSRTGEKGGNYPASRLEFENRA
jgi:hypothetical protein